MPDSIPSSDEPAGRVTVRIDGDVAETELPADLVSTLCQHPVDDRAQVIVDSLAEIEDDRSDRCEVTGVARRGEGRQRAEMAVAVEVPTPVLRDAAMAARRQRQSLRFDADGEAGGREDAWLCRQLLVDHLNARCTVRFRRDSEDLQAADRETIRSILADVG